ncbi:hypothetical protein TD95_004818 [Thielaviopsis punctulata]|uniref:Zn(2)-C6 fungal-type domain-containing protein n=1 Tax=Thielaviopsis punctulata TaxID=72032 RepID=A0A0F4ZJX5_9PEZI|nr:hypothetical protein TD95_004818 [Thielaviopsis punctulata]
MDPNHPLNLNMNMGIGMDMNPMMFPPPNFGMASHGVDYSVDIEDTSGCSVDGGPRSSPEMTFSADNSSVYRASPLLRRKKERRGHTKSRKGCFNCKRRRIKCQETRPECGHCVKTGLTCEYPNIPQITHQPHNQIPLFSLMDMRFFQHFISASSMMCMHSSIKPWCQNVPYLSHTHEYLMHSILGLAASDLTVSDPTLAPIARGHRYKAVQALKRRLNDIKRLSGSIHEADALIAACYALAYQSLLLDDGMVEFMACVRGILIVGMQMWVKGVPPSTIQRDGYISSNSESAIRPMVSSSSAGQSVIPVPRVPAFPSISRQWIDMASTAVHNLRQLCHNHIELEYHRSISDIVAGLYVSTNHAVDAMRRHYRWWMTMPHDQFRLIANINNQTMVLLATHWIALKQILATVINKARQAQAHTSVGGTASVFSEDFGVLRWPKHLNKTVDYSHMVYNSWPAWVEDQLDRDPHFFCLDGGMTSAMAS